MNKMSKNETPLTRRYWKSVGGALIEEFLAVKTSKDNGKRLIDGVIILGEKSEIFKAGEISIEDKNIVVVQAKASRLGMYLLGQALFSLELLKLHNPRSIRTVAICTAGDSVLEPLAHKYGIEVVVYDTQATSQ
jgi:hypothetical protein